MRSMGIIHLLIIGFSNSVIGNQYVVYPINRDNAELCATTTVRLQGFLDRNKVQTFSSQIRRTTDFWFVEAMPNQISSLTAMIGVCDRKRSA